MLALKGGFLSFLCPNLTIDASHARRMEAAMSYISPAVRPKFEELSINLKNQILERDVQLYTIHDLIQVLQDIVDEG